VCEKPTADVTLGGKTWRLSSKSRNKDATLASSTPRSTRRPSQSDQARERRKSQAWWYAPAIPALGRLRQEDPKFKASLSYSVRPYLKKKRNKRHPNWKEEDTLSLSADSRILCLKTPEATRKQLQLINECSEAAGNENRHENQQLW
jgi:hypothetical protein